MSRHHGNWLLIVVLAAGGACTTNAPLPEIHPPDEAVDPRYPVTMSTSGAVEWRQLMTGYLFVVNDVVDGLAAKDFIAVQAAARRLGCLDYNSPMCRHWGGATLDFGWRTDELRAAAHKLNQAAANEDSDGVVSALSETLAVCNACHRHYRQALEPPPP